MAAADTTLANLREIPLPPAVPYIPQTIGWLVVALLLLAVLAYVGWRVYQRHLKNRYRRDALAELAAIERKVRANASSREGLCELPALVKRTALAFAPPLAVLGVPELPVGPPLALLPASAVFAPLVPAPGKLLCPKGLYATVATPCSAHHGMTSCSMASSPRQP